MRYSDVSFEVPEAWIDLSVISLAGSDSKKFAPNLSLTRQDFGGGSLAAEAKKQLKDIKRQFKNHKLLAEGEAKVGDRPAYRLEHQVLSPERVRVRQVQYFFVSGRDLVVVSFSCADSEYEDRKKTFDAMAASFALEG